VNIIHSFINFEIMDSNTMALSAYGTELPFRQSVTKIPSERTAQVCLIDIN
jgi:hypothetical protein